MKKVLFSLAALAMVFFMSSCGDPTKKIEKLTEQIEENGDDWKDVDKWESVLRDFADAFSEFVESDPTEEELDDFEEALKDFYRAVRNLDGKAERMFDKANKKLDKDKDLNKKMEAVQGKVQGE